MKKKGEFLGEMYLREGLTENVIEYSQALDIPIAKQQRILLEEYLRTKNKKSK